MVQNDGGIVMARYIVETEFLYGWENVWTHGETNEPTIYNSYEDAKNELEEFIAETVEDYNNGFLEEPYDINQYRITKID